MMRSQDPCGEHRAVLSKCLGWRAVESIRMERRGLGSRAFSGGNERGGGKQ